VKDTLKASDLWQEIQALLDEAKDQEAIYLLEEQLPKVEDLNVMGQMAYQLAHIYRSSCETNNIEKAVHYAILAGQVYVRMGRIAPAVVILDWLKEEPKAKEPAQKFQKLIADIFSRKRVKRSKDDDHPPPTPFEQLNGFVQFEYDETSQLREQWKGYQLHPDFRITLFSKLDSRQVSELIDVATARELPPGTKLFQEGDDAFAFYIVADGEIELSSSVGFRKVFREGDFFGELALFGNRKRTATLQTSKGVTLLEFSKEKLTDLMQRMPQLRNHIMKFYELRLFMNVAGRSPLFKDFSASDLEELFDFFSSYTLSGGELLWDEGESSDCLFFIVNGYCDVEKDGKVISTLGPGQFVGEMGLIQTLPRTASVKAMNDCHLLGCHKLVYESLAQKFPKVHTMLQEMADLRGSSNNTEVPVID
jgi:CRP-like cAMP-binding protein